MASKDWKKKHDEKGFTGWFNPKTKGYISVSKQYYAPHLNKKQDWVVDVIDKKRFEKHFKTKTRALEYAKNYRKKH